MSERARVLKEIFERISKEYKDLNDTMSVSRCKADGCGGNDGDEFSMWFTEVNGVEYIFVHDRATDEVELVHVMVEDPSSLSWGELCCEYKPLLGYFAAWGNSSINLMPSAKMAELFMSQQ